MLQLTINEKGGPTRTESFDKEEVTIGRVSGNDIILPKGNISKRHSRVVATDGKLVIQDLKSTNGTYVNGKKISGPQVIKASDKVYIGDFTLQIEQEDQALQSAPRRPSSFGRGEEFDMFAGGDGFGGGGASSQGLIDENFDREFEPAERKSSFPGPGGNEVDLGSDFDAGPGPGEALDPVFDQGADMALDGAFEPGPSASIPNPDAVLPPSGPEVGGGRRRSRPPSVISPTPAPRPESPPVPPLSSATESPPAVVRAYEATPPQGLDAEAAAPTSIPSFRTEAMPAPTLLAAPSVDPWGESELLFHAQRSLQDALEISTRSPTELNGLRDEAVAIATQALESLSPYWPPGFDALAAVDKVVGKTVDVGPLADLLVDDNVFEVVVGPDGQILVDREGRLESSGLPPMGERARLNAAHTLASLAGASPECVEGSLSLRLRNGARFLATLPPLAYRGPSFSVRKTTRDFVTLENLREYDTIDDAMLQILDATVRYRRGILLSTGPGVSPTASLNALVARIPREERVVAAERGIELHFQGHPYALGFDLSLGMTMDDVVRYAEHAQADRLVAGELAEADVTALFSSSGLRLDVAAASVAAESSEQAVHRLETWISQGVEDKRGAARAALARSFALVVHEKRFPDESRRITSVQELQLVDGQLQLEPLFHFGEGGFEAAGRLPTFIEAAPSREPLEV